VKFVESCLRDDILRTELDAFREGRSEGSWENFLYFVARLYFDSHGEEGRQARRRSEQECGGLHIRSTTALRVPAQIIPLSRLRRERMDPRLGDWTRTRSRRPTAVIVNIDYPLGVAAYNILREVAIDSATLRAVYVLGQGGDAERGRGRRDAVERRARRALGLDLLARQRVQRRRHRARPALRQRARQPARGHGEEHVPAEPLLPRLLLPRGVHGGGDGGGPYCNALYEIADADRHPGERGA
jgi:hypothetical protein